jgi:mannitol-specific phosphotransferase system IIBC component
MLAHVAILIAEIGTVGWISLAGVILALSETVNGAILGLLVAIFVAFLASLKKLALMLLRFGEAVATHKIESWAESHGVDPEDILE